MRPVSVTRTPNVTREQARDQALRRLRDAVIDNVADGRSVAELTVERLTDTAGMARSTFYVHFPDKGALVEALAAGLEDDTVRSAESWWSLGPDVDEAQLREAMERIVDGYRTHGGILTAIDEVAAYDPGVRERTRSQLDRSVGGLRAHIEAGQAGGYVDRELDPPIAALWLTRLVQRGITMLVVPADAEQTDARVTELTRIVWSALYAPVRSGL
ncbi:MAG: TetR/AcrR family transcriptional regulator [Solirubrobacteraceae bacterium]